MIQVRGAGCSRNLLALHHFSIRYRVGAKRHHMLCLNMCHDDKVSAAQCSTGITFSGFYPRFYRAGSKGFWGSGTHHMSVGSCQGGRVCNSGCYGMFLCFHNGSTCGTYIPTIKAGSITSGNVYFCLPGFHHLVNSVQLLAVRCSPSLNVPAVTVLLSLCKRGGERRERREENK